MTASNMEHSRRTFLKGLGTVVAGLRVSTVLAAESGASLRKPHLITLSFDDGFKKSFTRTAEIYEKHKLAACLNVIADGIPDEEWINKWPLGDFTLWNELKRRGHEIMPHGYRH